MKMTRHGFTDAAEAEGQYFNSDFHRMSQDLRNPLNAINGFAELLLLDDSLSPASAEHVRAILAAGRALTDTVVGYLDRAECGAAALPVREPRPVARPAAFKRPAGLAVAPGFQHVPCAVAL